MHPKIVDTKEYKIDEFARAPDEVIEYNRRTPINENERGNHNTLFLKRSLFSPDIHVREVLGYLLAKECGIPACESELAIYPMLNGHFEDAVISYSELSKNDRKYLPITLVKEYRNKVGIKTKVYWMLDIEGTFNTVFGLMNENGRPVEEYNKFVQDFINMMMFDIKFVNSDRDNKNWLLRKNDVTGEIDLYPLFDNASIFASEREPTENITEEEAKKLSDNHPLLILTPEDFQEGKTETNYRDMLEYLFRKYPKQSTIALEMVSKIDEHKLEEIIDSIPGIRETRKQQMLEVFRQRNKGVLEKYNEIMNNEKIKT